MLKSFPILLMAIISSVAFAQKNVSSAPKLPDYIGKPDDASGLLPIYPNNGVPPGSESWKWHEQSNGKGSEMMVRNVVIPTLTVFEPAPGTANGTSMIVAPGGAFYFLMMENEGYQMARWLSKLGIKAFVLKYRVQHTPPAEANWKTFADKLWSELPRVRQFEIYPPMSHPGAEEARLWGEADAIQAVRYLRGHATELGISPSRIGMVGFSAGSGIAVNAATAPDSSGRPDFVGAIYAGYRIVSPVPDHVPPLFIAIADDDKAVAPISSARLFEDWHKLGRPVELHIFSNGSHGFGTKQQNKLTDAWLSLFQNWMTAQGFL